MGLSVLITGAAGFVGQALVGKLERSGAVDLIYALDRAVELPGGGKAVRLQADVLKDYGWAKRLGRVDSVVHLIGSPGVWFSEKKPEEDMLINFMSLVNVLDGLEGKGLKHVILASTCQVYGPPGAAEDKQPAPQNNYGINKLMAEHYLRNHCKKRGLDHTIFRTTWVYGPGQKKNPVYDIISVFLHGGGMHLSLDSELDFIYVDDVAAAFEAALNDGPWLNQTVNISGGRPVKLELVFEAVSAILGMRKEIREPLPTVRFWLPNQKALSFGWRPETGLEEGVLKTLEAAPRGVS